MVCVRVSYSCGLQVYTEKEKNEVLDELQDSYELVIQIKEWRNNR